ncbi:MAG: hypothetical protein KAG19_01755 [Methylococcales bacterium]|nr:hypothetical protein [Methylococcales bacterium]
MDFVVKNIGLTTVLNNAPGNPLIWSWFLSELVSQLSCDSGVLLVTDLLDKKNTHFLYSSHVSEKYQALYENRLNEVDGFNLLISKMPLQAISHLMLREESGGMSFDDQGVRFGVAIPCSKNYSLNLLVSRKKLLGRGEEALILDALQSIVSPLEHAVKAEQRHKIDSQLVHSFDNDYDGYIIIDRALNILFSDPLHTSVISQLESVNIVGDQFGMTDPVIEQQLIKLLNEVGVDETTIYNQRDACQITLMPISSLHNLYRWECYKDGFIVRFIHDKEKTPMTNRLVDIYHLSKSEAMCALHFMKTPSVSGIAKQTYRSVETVRNHIKHTMQKMDVHNQAELMKKLLTLATI